MPDTLPLFERYYFKQAGYASGTTAFHDLCARWLPSDGTLLEIGAGPPNATSDFLATLGRVTGVDIGPEVMDNRALTDARMFDGVHMPFDHSSFDGCVSNYVLEHVKDVKAHFCEVGRVLRPGGCYVFRTPNLRHYVALVSRLLPHAMHNLLANRLRRLPEDAHEPWPTFYQANTRARIHSVARAAGLEIAALTMIEPEPSYARASAALFYPLMAYERLVNSGAWGAPFRANILGVVRKPY